MHPPYIPHPLTLVAAQAVSSLPSLPRLKLKIHATAGPAQPAPPPPMQPADAWQLGAAAAAPSSHELPLAPEKQQPFARVRAAVR